MYSASIVLYKTSFSTIQELINSILNSGKIHALYLIDNSAVDDRFLEIADNRIIYQESQKNIGFGAAHNLAIKKACELGSELHFFINPDIALKPDVIHGLIDAMNSDKSIGLMMPTILNADGSIQHLPKLLPSPFSIMARKLNFVFPFLNKYIFKYELRNLPSVGLFDIPIVSGCFSVIRREAIEHINGFDERFFLYFEDWDLSRRISQRYRTVINTSVEVVHEYNSGANKNPRLFFFFMSSAIKYFLKWGFLFDKDRNRVNKNAIDLIKNA